MDTNRRLRSDHVDGFLVHFPRGDIDALAEGLDLAHHNGIATHVGCSNFGILELRRLHAALAKRGVALAFNEIEFSLLRSAPAETDGLLDVCRELDVKVLSWAPLGSGRLAGRHADDVADPATRRLIGALDRVGIDRRRGGAARPGDAATRAIHTQALDRVAAARGKTRAAVAINWCICKGTVPIPGARTPEQARENCAGAGWRLSAEEVAGLDAHALRDGGFYSDPEAILCFAGIRLPRVLRGFAHAVVRFVLPLVTYFLPLQRG